MDLLILTEPRWQEIDNAFHWVEFAIPQNQIKLESGFCYVYPWRTSAAKFFAQFPTYSKLVINENGIALPHKSAKHAEIREFGAGRFSMWSTGIYFSSMKNSDPRTGNDRYTVALPSYIQFLESLPQSAIDKHRF